MNATTKFYSVLIVVLALIIGASYFAGYKVGYHAGAASARATHRAAGSIESRENAVACTLDESSPMFLDYSSREFVVAIEEPPPLLIAFRDGAAR